MSESWKIVPGYDMYEVSDRGCVRSWNRHAGSPGRCKEPRILKTALDGAGYPMVNLCKDGQGKTLRIHRLVLEAFVGKRPPGLECCHGDGSPANNHLSNLRWDTSSANRRDAFTHGTWVLPDNRGEACSTSKLTTMQVMEIRRRYATGKTTYRELGSQFDVHFVTIGRIVRGERWAHVGS